jgi:hypothetical protein
MTPPTVPTVFLELSGGVVQAAYADGPVQVVVLDYDVNEEPSDDNYIRLIPQGSYDPEEAYVVDPCIEINPLRVKELLWAIQ